MATRRRGLLLRVRTGAAAVLVLTLTLLHGALATVQPPRGPGGGGTTVHAAPTSGGDGVLAPASPVNAREDPFDVAVRHAQAFAIQRVKATAARIPPRTWPAQTSGLLWRTTSAGAWSSGLFPGQLWYAYQASGDTTLRVRAERWQAGLAPQSANTATHDLGFIVFDSFGNGYRLTGTDRYRDVVLDAAASLATRYSPTVHAVRSWNSGSAAFKVIIDTMMNLELLLWASKHGGKHAWYDLAVAHALTTAQHHVRPDGSTYQLVTFNPTTGAVVSRTTVQGAADSSTWSRGQAWAIHGFTATYRETGDPAFLRTARRVADYYVAHLPSDLIPYWDFDAPAIPDEPRDTSAAAIAASGLLELSQLEPDPARSARYLATARATLQALVGPPWSSQGSGSESVLLHGTYSKPGGTYDTGLIWGDHFFQEALVRLRTVPPSGISVPVMTAVASADDGNAAANAVDGNPATRWSAWGDGQWLLLDLGTSRSVSKVTVAWFRGDQRAARFDLQTSDDGLQWRTRVRALSSGMTTGPETYDVADTTARYVRLIGHGAAGTMWNCVTEVAVVG